MNIIFHICSRLDWEKAKERGEYLAQSLREAGFIHCSTSDQILRVANQYYSGASGLVVLWIDSGKVLPEIRWEAADSDRFPHIYGPLNLDSVVKIQDFLPDEDGIFRAIPD